MKNKIVESEDGDDYDNKEADEDGGGKKFWIQEGNGCRKKGEVSEQIIQTCFLIFLGKLFNISV